MGNATSDSGDQCPSDLTTPDHFKPRYLRLWRSLYAIVTVLLAYSWDMTVAST